MSAPVASTGISTVGKAGSSRKPPKTFKRSRAVEEVVKTNEEEEEANAWSLLLRLALHVTERSTRCTVCSADLSRLGPIRSIVCQASFCLSCLKNEEPDECPECGLLPRLHAVMWVKDDLIHTAIDDVSDCEKTATAAISDVHRSLAEMGDRVRKAPTRAESLRYQACLHRSCDVEEGQASRKLKKRRISPEATTSEFPLQQGLTTAAAAAAAAAH